jgi:hypothetical protein
VLERLTDRVERAGADVAEHHTERTECERALARMRNVPGFEIVAGHLEKAYEPRFGDAVKKS